MALSTLPSMTGAVFVVGGASGHQQGPVASMVSTAGWASAAERVTGAAWIVMPSGQIGIDDARRVGSAPHLRAPSVRTFRQRVPTVAKTLVKDVRQFRHARSFEIAPDARWRRDPPAFVWQRHELFQTAGLDLARDLRVPSVVFVPSTIVWEAERWKTRRPGWAGLVERFGERPTLQAADVVAAGTGEVAEQVVRLGVDPRRVIVTPTGVDLAMFDASPDRGAVRLRLGLDGRFVIGWVGSFRRFHALDRVVEAMSGVDGWSLLLVGDGPERRGVERLAAERGVHLVTTGTVFHGELPEMLAAMDVGVVLAGADESFHYSPLKLAEYLAAGLPVVAPAIGQLAERLHHEVDCLLVAPGDRDALVRALRRLHADSELREEIGATARQTAVDAWSWDLQVRRVLEAIREIGPRDHAPES